MNEELPDILELWEAFLETAPAGVAIFGTDMRYLQASARWLKDFRIENWDIIRRSHYEIMPDIPEKWRESHRRCLAGAEESCDADPFPHPDGTVDWVRWQARPWHRRDGKIGGIVILAEVITDRVLAEQALRESEARYRTLIERAPDAIVIYDMESRCAVHANRRAEQLFGLPQAELIARRVSSFYHPDQPDGMPLDESLARHERMAMGDQLPKFERRIVSAQGKESYCEVTVTRLPTAVGNLCRISYVDITDRRQAEVRLRQEEAKYRGLVEQQISGIVIIDENGLFAYVNPHFAEIVGRPAEALIGRPLFDVIPPAEQEKVREKLGSQLTGGDVFVQALSTVQRPTGEIRDVIINATRSSWQGRPASTAVLLDVTDNRRLAEALRLSEEKYRSTVDMAPVGIVHIDAEGRFLMVNECICSMLGYSRDELLGTSFLDVTWEEDLQGSRAVLERVANGNRVLGRMVKRYRHRDGHAVWTEVNYLNDGQPDGTERRGMAVINDITEKRRLDEALRLSEEKYRSTVDMAPMGIVYIEDTGRFMMVNDFMCNMVGYSRDELLGMSFLDITVEEDREECREMLARMASGQQTEARIVKRYRHRDGHPVWTEVSCLHDMEQDGTGRVTLAVINDITARKQAEADGARLEAQLRQAQKMEAIGQLTGGLAHDFNNLLAVILGNLDFLKEEGGYDADAAELLEDATRATLKGAELTRNLLAFARRQPLAPTVTDVAEVLRQVGRLVARTLGEQISVEVDLTPDPWPVMIDVVQLESAILNLAVNARDAMPNGGRLTVQARNAVLDADALERNPEASPGDYVAISVSDTGTGMPPEVAAKVFEPFFTTKGTRGSGLGLSMVHGFVKQSGGHTALYTEPGHGTTVRIYLPRAGRPAAEAAPDAREADLARGHEMVLAVEDNDGLRRLVVRRLADLGYTPIEARDATEALRILGGAQPIDLLFTDIVLPGGTDGRQLAAEARRLRPGLKVLFTTGFASMPVGGDGEFSLTLLTKPYQKQTLAQSLRAAIDGE
jgi:PAS domain S-box-containing protein